jgi:hypothetical protein
MSDPLADRLDAHVGPAFNASHEPPRWRPRMTTADVIDDNVAATSTGRVSGMATQWPDRHARYTASEPAGEERPV